ncbi:MAG: hypothetical protein K6T83_22660 [Alicyclobacillus sp.]|nr:hypothetical protein [Alicyclobacillus sp.]
MKLVGIDTGTTSRASGGARTRRRGGRGNLSYDGNQTYAEALSGLLGRRRPVMDPSHACGIGGTWGLAWDEPALEAAGIDTRLLPERVPFGTRAGETSSGTPVFVAIGDNQASFLGAVAPLGYGHPGGRDAVLSRASRRATSLPSTS